jgi:hypothetical protein
MIGTRARGGRSAAVVLAGAALLACPPTGPAAAAADGYPAGVRVAPAALPRGEDTLALHAVGHTIVDGTRRVRTDLAGPLRLVGRARHGWVVATSEASTAATTLWRVRPDGFAVRLRDIGAGGDDARTSATGTRVAYTVQGRAGRPVTRVVVVRSSDGSAAAVRRYHGYLKVLDVRRRVLLTGVQPSRTLWYDPRSDTTTLAFRRELSSADIAADRALRPVSDPSGLDRQCLVESRLSDLSAVRWRSCTDKPLAVSPGSTRMVTTYIEADGLGSSLVQLRDAGTNAVQATYRTAGYFGAVSWESERSFLVMTWSRGRAAIVRITTGGTVERVSRIVRMRADGDGLRWSFPPS